MGLEPTLCLLHMQHAREHKARKARACCCIAELSFRWLVRIPPLSRGRVQRFVSFQQVVSSANGLVSGSAVMDEQ